MQCARLKFTSLNCVRKTLNWLDFNEICKLPHCWLRYLSNLFNNHPFCLSEAAFDRLCTLNNGLHICIVRWIQSIDKLGNIEDIKAHNTKYSINWTIQSCYSHTRAPLRGSTEGGRPSAVEPVTTARATPCEMMRYFTTRTVKYLYVSSSDNSKQTLIVVFRSRR